MKYCTYCGSGIDDTASFCPNCGAKAGTSESFEATFDSTTANNAPEKDHTENIGILILSLFVPIVGLVFYLMWNETKPGMANSALKGLLISIILSVPILGIILYFVWKNEKPDFAKISLYSGIASIILIVVFMVLYFGFIIAAVLVGSGGYYYDTYEYYYFIPRIISHLI